MRWIILLSVVLFFSYSCSEKEKMNISDNLDSTRYYLDFWGKSGLYYNVSYFVNLCSYSSMETAYGNSYLQKNPLSFEALKQLKKTNLLDTLALDYQGHKVKIEYNLLDSIPRVYYEIVDTYLRNKPRKLGKLYLIYENESIENNGKSIFVSDTTLEYGFFIMETCISSSLNKHHNMNFPTEMSVKIKGNKTLQGSYKQVSPTPYRLISDEEVNLIKQKNEKP